MRSEGGATALRLITAPTTTGQNCLLSESPDGPASSCLAGTDLFAQHEVVYLVQSDGGPDPAQLDYLRVDGVAAPGVDSIQVVFKSGTIYPISLNASNAFDFEAPLATIHAGDTPTTLVAYSNGSAVGVFPLSQ